jgi:hypothetical protein
MGTAWPAHDELLDHDVAVKEVTLPAGLDDAGRAELFERILHEVLVVVGARTPSVTALPRACDLLTVKDAEALISRAKVSATAPPTPNPTVTDCEFATGDEALRAARNPVLLVNLKWYRDGADKAVTDIADRRQKSGSYLGTLFPGAPRSRHFISVPDLGDEAFFFGGTHGDDKGRTLESLVVYRLGNVVVLVAHSRQNATRASDDEAVGPIKERVIEAARRTVEVLER